MAAVRARRRAARDRRARRPRRSVRGGGRDGRAAARRRGVWATAALGAGASLLVNNLPAAVVLSAHVPAHPPLLVGLDIGPNLAVPGSLSAVLWLQAARSAGARPLVRSYTLLGILVAPLGIAAAVGAFHIFSPKGF